MVILASRNMGVEVIWWDADYARPFGELCGGGVGGSTN